MVTPTIRLCTLGIKKNPDFEYSVYQNPGFYFSNREFTTFSLFHSSFLCSSFFINDGDVDVFLLLC
jgi:hypothetical protein